MVTPMYQIPFFNDNFIRAHKSWRKEESGLSQKKIKTISKEVKCNF